MKKQIVLSFATGTALCLAGCSNGKSGVFSVLLLLLGLLALALAALRTLSLLQYHKRIAKKRGRSRPFRLDMITYGLYGAGLLLLILTLVVSCSGPKKQTPAATEPAVSQPPAEEQVSPFRPAAVPETEANQFGVTWEAFENGKYIVDYVRPDPISFGQPEDYFALPGIATFRGNNFRNSPTYGTATITDKEINIAWSADTGHLSGTSWGGSGWTGQPLIVQWDAQTRRIMNLYEEKKGKLDLVEVIYATLAGKIYFLDLEDGTPTRDPIDVGLCFKGAGSLDPRGYPLLYVGAGDVNGSGKRPRMHVISLIDGSILYEYGDEDTLSLRQDNDRWCAFDSAPLVDAGSDTLIWPGENGILYTIKLNTQYDQAAGTIAINPDTPVVARYDTPKSSVGAYWLGYEASANIVDHYLYVSENGGLFYCVDLNTMELVWVQDTQDDSNASPVFEMVSESEGYLYTAPSLHWKKDTNNKGTISVYKLDAITGEIVWETPFQVYTQDGVSGGMQSTPLLGKPGTNLEGMLFCSISRTPNEGTGILVALDTATGNELWRVTTDYFAWSSPVVVYDENGYGYVALGDSSGKMHFVDGKTGTVTDVLTLNSNIEASPAVFNGMLVLGTRGEKIYGIQAS